MAESPMRAGEGPDRRGRASAGRRPEIGVPSLLLASLAAVLAVVAAVSVLASVTATWAVVAAMAVAVGGLVGVVAVVVRQLGDDEGHGSEDRG